MELYKRKGIPWRIIDREALVVDPQSSLVYPFNRVAARIWQLLDGTRGLPEITKMICGEFEADKEIAAQDTEDFIAQLKEAGLIEKL